jgi:hypothetical protein
MKKNIGRIISLLSFCFLSLNLFSQRATLPTIGEVYNFSPGDTFEYRLTDLNTNRVTMYIDRVVLTRDDSHYPDYLTYTIQQIYLDSNGLNPAVWDTFTRVYHHCTDTIFPYNGFISCQDETDSCGATTAITSTTDSSFPGFTVYHADFNCGFANSGWSNVAIGLGVVHSHTECGDFAFQQFDILLVHYHHQTPTTGFTTVGEEGLPLKAFPNPTIDQFTLTLRQDLIGRNVYISDILGRQISAIQMLTTSYVIPTAGFANGVYFISITGGPKTGTLRLVISR